MAAIAAVTVSGALGFWLPMAAGATPPPGTLTSLEYSQLSEMYSGLLNTTTGTNWKALTAACEKAGSSTPLLATQRSSCVDQISTLSYIETVSSAQKKCDSAIAARSGAARPATVEDLAAMQEIACLNPEYQELGRLAGASYAQDVAARKVAIARGFTGVCLATLVDTRSQIATVHQFALTAERVAQDAGGLTKLAAKRALPRPAEITHFESDSTAFGQAFEAMTRLSGPTKLSVCRHR
jgi:hypothetical protein